MSQYNVNPENLYSFAYITDWDERLKNLAEKIAQYEDWFYQKMASEEEYPILKNYLNYTYKRLLEQNKIESNSKAAWFNTGLVTGDWEDIYALFEQNKNTGNQPWYLKGFYRGNHFQLKLCSPLPLRATYFDDPSELIYDTRLNMRIDYEHIEFNRERFPETHKLLPSEELKRCLDGAINIAKKRVEINYKTATPQFFTDKNAQKGKLQLLLPLCLKESSTADLALVIDIVTTEDGDRYYFAETVLTLDMAYNNARLICKPDTEWLLP